MSFRVEECEHCGEDALGAPDEARQLHRVRGLERMAVAPSGRPAACAAPSADGRAALVGRRSLEFVAACGFINAKAPGYEAAFFRNCRRVRHTRPSPCHETREQRIGLIEQVHYRRRD
jgi:hypothetical protein